MMDDNVWLNVVGRWWVVEGEYWLLECFWE